MSKEKKISQPLSMRMNHDLFEKLEKFCEDSGQSKTTAIERSLSKYIEEYYEMMDKIKEGK